ncbi:MAG: hypothetical protein RL223_2976 [Pseudomonadota bacterium]|jgi:undecaprenyl-diphosphatase
MRGVSSTPASAPALPPAGLTIRCAVRPPLRRAVRPALVWLAVFALVGLACALQQGPLDRALFHGLNAWGPQAPGLWSALSVAGLGLSLLLLVGAAGPRQAATVDALLLTVLFGGLLVQALKWTWADARPLAVLGAAQVHVLGERLHGRSMPSGHTAMACAALVLVWPRLRGAAPRLLAAAFAVGVALSRSAVGAHWPSDLLAGAALGAAVAWSVDRGLARRHRATVPAPAEPAAGSAAAAAATAAPASSPSPPSTAAPRATTPTPGRQRAIAIGLLVGAVAIVLQPAAGATAAALQWVLAACGLVGAWRWWPRPPVTAGAPHPPRPPTGSATPARPATPTGPTREAAAATALTSAASAAATPCP